MSSSSSTQQTHQPESTGVMNHEAGTLNPEITDLDTGLDIYGLPHWEDPETHDSKWEAIVKMNSQPRWRDEMIGYMNPRFRQELVDDIEDERIVCLTIDEHIAILRTANPDITDSRIEDFRVEAFAKEYWRCGNAQAAFMFAYPDTLCRDAQDEIRRLFSMPTVNNLTNFLRDPSLPFSFLPVRF